MSVQWPPQSGVRSQVARGAHRIVTTALVGITLVSLYFVADGTYTLVQRRREREREPSSALAEEAAKRMPGPSSPPAVSATSVAAAAGATVAVVDTKQ